MTHIDVSQANPPSLKRFVPNRTWQLAAVGIVLVSLVRWVSGVDSLTSSGSFAAAIGSAVPIMMAGLGALVSERAGVINISLEGSMILGTFGAGWIGWQHGPWLGLLAAVLFGTIGAIVHATATVTFGVDQIISGVAVNILALGLSQYLATAMFQGTPGGGRTQSPPIPPIGRVSLPGADWMLGALEDTHIVVVSDVAAALRAALVDVPIVTVIAFALVVATSVVLWRTAFGLRHRMCGEDPFAADTLGVNVVRHKYAAVVASGAFAGLGGGYLAIVAANIYREGQTAGRGFIGLGTVVFGNWMPSGMAGGAALFGYIDSQQLRSEAGAHAMLLLLAAFVAAVTLYLAWKRDWKRSTRLGLIAGATALWYAATDVLPPQAAFIAPYVATLVVLAAAGKGFRPPKMTGVPFRKGEQS